MLLQTNRASALVVNRVKTCLTSSLSTMQTLVVVSQTVCVHACMSSQFYMLPYQNFVTVCKATSVQYGSQKVLRTFCPPRQNWSFWDKPYDCNYRDLPENCDPSCPAFRHLRSMKQTQIDQLPMTSC